MTGKSEIQRQKRSAAITAGVAFAKCLIHADTPGDGYRHALSALKGQLDVLGSAVDLSELEDPAYSDRDDVTEAGQHLLPRVLNAIRNSSGDDVGNWFELPFLLFLTCDFSEAYYQGRLVELADAIGYDSEKLLPLWSGSDPDSVADYREAIGHELFELAGARLAFISYASEDLAVAKDFAERLEAQGMQVFMASADLHAGQRWQQELLQALRGCDQLIVIASAHSLSSNWVLQEIGAAWALGKPIIAACLGVQPGQLPELLRQFQCHDMGSPDDRDELAKLITDGFPPPMEDKCDRLAAAIAAPVGTEKSAPPNSSASRTVDPDATHGETPKPAGEFPEELEDDLDAAESSESIGDVWSAESEYESLAKKLESMGKEQLASEMKRRAKLNRRAAAQMMRGD